MTVSYVRAHPLKHRELHLMAVNDWVPVILGALIIAWLVGSIIFRTVGGVIIVGGLCEFVFARSLHVSDIEPLIVCGIGLAVWLFGHWMYAAKNSRWRFRLPQIILVWLHPRLDPTDGQAAQICVGPCNSDGKPR